jgi:outer membrane immunogenic protein
MMTKFLATAALLASTAFATAADLPPRPKAPAATGPDWTGFYLGVTGGYGWSNAKSDLELLSDLDPKGWTIGGYAGYNWQVANSMVVGIEGGYMQSSLKADKALVEEVTVTTKVDRLADIRARAGLLITPHILAYGTGGVAWGSAHESIGDVVARGNHWGWVAGAGLETRLGNKLSLGLEYLHYSLGDAGYAITGGPSINTRLTTDVVRAKVGLQF